LSDPKKRDKYNEDLQQDKLDAEDNSQQDDVEEFNWSDFFGGMDVEDLEQANFEDDDFLGSYARKGRQDPDDDEDEDWDPETDDGEDLYVDDEDEPVVGRKKSKKTKQKRETQSVYSSLKNSEAAARKDVRIHDSPRTYLTAWIGDLSNNNYGQFSVRKQVWVVLIYSSRSGFRSRMIQEFNAFAFKFNNYIKVMKLVCTKASNICQDFNYKGSDPVIQIWEINATKPKIVREDDFSMSKLEAKILKKFDEYNWVPTKNKETSSISDDILPHWGNSDVRPVITLYINKKDIIFAHTLVTNYKNV
jgi:hypothetical protein